MFDLSQLSPADIERMRQIVGAADTQGKINEFDLNKPPQAPYVYREFPRLVYHHKNRVHKPVHNQEQLDAALAEGHRIDPFPSEIPSEPELNVAEQAEVAALDKEARKPRKA